jgi:hypothetical protein
MFTKSFNYFSTGMTEASLACFTGTLNTTFRWSRKGRIFKIQVPRARRCRISKATSEVFDITTSRQVIQNTSARVKKRVRLQLNDIAFPMKCLISRGITTLNRAFLHDVHMFSKITSTPKIWRCWTHGTFSIELQHFKSLEADIYALNNNKWTASSRSALKSFRLAACTTPYMFVLQQQQLVATAQ